MSYYINRRLRLPFEDAVARIKAGLGEQGFGIPTDIDVQAVMKAKLGESFRPYRILGACNPSLANWALTAEDKIGTMLPCNIIVQEHMPGDVEVAAIDPVSSMATVGNPDLEPLAQTVRERLSRALAGL